MYSKKKDYRLINAKEAIPEFIKIMSYCVKLSLQASAFYTIARLLGRILTPAFGIASSFLAKYIIDLLAGAWNPADRVASLTMLLAGTLIIALATACLRKIVQYCQTMHNELLNKQISMLVMDKALCADIEFFDNPAYYNKLTAAARDSYSLVNVLWNILECISSFITFIGAFTVLCSSFFTYGIAVVCAAIPSAIAGAKYTKDLYKLSIDQIKGERKKNYLQNITTMKQYSQDIRLFNAGGYIKDKYIKLWNTLFCDRRKMLKKRSIITGIFECLPEIIMVYIAIDISFRVFHGNSTVGDYSLYTGLSTQLSASIFALTTSIIQVYDDKLRIANIKKLDEFSNRVVDKGMENLEYIRTIEFCNVSFAYPGTGRNVLEDISFVIGEAEKVALVGLNGSGKSTLIKLLLRFYDPDKGTVKINGRDIREYSLASLRKCFSVYFQDMPNYSFTLRENITIADNAREEGDEPIKQALFDSDALDILERTQRGLDTYLSRLFEDDGIELSGGQNQKVALARAFYRRHSALILDEPSSNLDPEAEHRVFEALRRLCRGKTTIFTSHRLSNVVLADKIIVLESGRIVEQGTQSELLRNRRRYAELFKYQQDKYGGSVNVGCNS